MQAWRNAVVEEAITWLGTPFLDKQRVKNAGCDCSGLVFSVFRALKLLNPDFEMPDFSPQFFAHRDQEIFIEGLLKAGFKEIEGPAQPGDVLLARYGRVYSHSAIVVDWPKVIHANPNARKVQFDNADCYRLFAGRPRKLFTLAESI